MHTYPVVGIAGEALETLAGVVANGIETEGIRATSTRP
jgi:hypothetical protein